jgi:two-component system, sensor histidine kinase and response regulator
MTYHSDNNTGKKPPGEKVNILLVDDQPAKLMSLEVILSDLGENLVMATTGREALECLLKLEFAVILLDVNMPDMDGFETAHMIRQRPSLERTPIIFVTGYNTTDIDRLKGYDIGAADYLFLPVVPQVLRAKVQVFVDLARQKQIISRQAHILAQNNQQQEGQIRMIQELNQKLKSAYEELETFSYSVSHDLRSPLRALQGYSYLLLHEFEGRFDITAEDYLRRIDKAAGRMDALIRDVLAYTTVSRVGVKTQPVDLAAMLYDLVQEHLTIRKARGEITIKPPIHRVIGHEACLIQCLSNLLDNASKFVPPGRTPKIQVSTETAQQWVRICVHDNGIGIDPSDHSRIFHMFERGSNGKEYEGTGIGLTIVKKAVERMGGRVGFESEPENGSRFWIELPAVAEQLAVSDV